MHSEMYVLTKMIMINRPQIVDLTSTTVNAVHDEHTESN